MQLKFLTLKPQDNNVKRAAQLSLPLSLFMIRNNSTWFMYPLSSYMCADQLDYLLYIKYIWLRKVMLQDDWPKVHPKMSQLNNKWSTISQALKFLQVQNWSATQWIFSILTSLDILGHVGHDLLYLRVCSILPNHLPFRGQTLPLCIMYWKMKTTSRESHPITCYSLIHSQNNHSVLTS